MAYDINDPAAINPWTKQRNDANPDWAKMYGPQTQTAPSAAGAPAPAMKPGVTNFFDAATNKTATQGAAVAANQSAQQGYGIGMGGPVKVGAVDPTLNGVGAGIPNMNLGNAGGNTVTGSRNLVQGTPAPASSTVVHKDANNNVITPTPQPAPVVTASTQAPSGQGVLSNGQKVDAAKLNNDMISGAVKPGDNGLPTPGGDATGAGAGAKDISSMWADVLNSHDAGKQGLFDQANADEANASRRNAEMNAVTGGGAGGAFAGGQAQTAIGGMQARQKALSDFNKQGVELKMARLDQLIKQAEASGDRNLQRELQAESDRTALLLKQTDSQNSIDQTNTLAKSINATGGY